MMRATEILYSMLLSVPRTLRTLRAINVIAFMRNDAKYILIPFQFNLINRVEFMAWITFCYRCTELE